MLLTGGIQGKQSVRDVFNILLKSFSGFLPFICAEFVQTRHNPFTRDEFAHQSELFQRHKQFRIAAVYDFQEIPFDITDFPCLNSKILTDSILGMDNVIPRLQIIVMLDDFRIAEYIFISSPAVMNFKQFRGGINRQILFGQIKTLGQLKQSDIDAIFDLPVFPENGIADAVFIAQFDGSADFLFSKCDDRPVLFIDQSEPCLNDFIGQMDFFNAGNVVFKRILYDFPAVRGDSGNIMIHRELRNHFAFLHHFLHIGNGFLIQFLRGFHDQVFV